jgi:aminoglycoside phosphotransferase family enzyme
MLNNQQDVIDFLSVPSGPAIERVDIIETHVPLVFFACDRAYKLKRAVKYLTSTSLPRSTAGAFAKPSSL